MNKKEQPSTYCGSQKPSFFSYTWHRHKLNFYVILSEAKNLHLPIKCLNFVHNDKNTNFVGIEYTCFRQSFLFKQSIFSSRIDLAASERKIPISDRMNRICQIDCQSLTGIMGNPINLIRLVFSQALNTDIGGFFCKQPVMCSR